jgi:hypothetical protein
MRTVLKKTISLPRILHLHETLSCVCQHTKIFLLAVAWLGELAPFLLVSTHSRQLLLSIFFCFEQFLFPCILNAFRPIRMKDDRLRILRMVSEAEPFIGASPLRCSSTPQLAQPRGREQRAAPVITKWASPMESIEGRYFFLPCMVSLLVV